MSDEEDAQEVLVPLTGASVPLTEVSLPLPGAVIPTMSTVTTLGWQAIIEIS